MNKIKATVRKKEKVGKKQSISLIFSLLLEPSKTSLKNGVFVKKNTTRNTKKRIAKPGNVSENFCGEWINFVQSTRKRTDADLLWLILLKGNK